MRFLPFINAMMWLPLVVLVWIHCICPTAAFTMRPPLVLSSLRKTVIPFTSTSSSDNYVEALFEDANDKELSTASTPRIENPMWPNGVSSEDIDELVDEILADESINLPQLPDFLERQIYKTTTLLTLNAAYRLVGWVHGKRLWGHYFALTRVRCSELYRRTRQKSLLHMKTDVDEDLLEQVADQLLANKAINQPLVPDVVERQLYVNCLKIIFRILNMLAASLRITLCGHDLTLNLTRALDRKSLKKVARTAASSETPIDTQVLRELARAKVVADDEAGGATSVGNANDTSLWKQGQQEFVVQVNTVLYSLILGIIDDLLANTELELMTDRIRVDILEPSEGAKLAAASKRRNRKRKRALLSSKKKKKTTKSSKTLPILTFVLGTVIGMASGRFFF